MLGTKLGILHYFKKNYISLFMRHIWCTCKRYITKWINKFLPDFPKMSPCLCERYLLHPIALLLSMKAMYQSEFNIDCARCVFPIENVRINALRHALLFFFNQNSSCFPKEVYSRNSSNVLMPKLDSKN